MKRHIEFLDILVCGLWSEVSGKNHKGCSPAVIFSYSCSAEVDGIQTAAPVERILVYRK